jgi:hypothetical protein
MIRPIAVTDQERQEYDRPLTESEIIVLIYACRSKLARSKSASGVRRYRILIVKLNNLLKGVTK